MGNREITDVRDLLELTELTDVQFFELAAKRKLPPQGPHENGSPLSDSIDAEDSPVEILQQREIDAGEPIQILLHADKERLVIRAVMAVDGPDAEYRIDAAIVYTLSEPSDVEEAVKVEFAERVGIMALYPFLREALYSMAARMRLEAPLLGILRAGQIKLTADAPTATPDS